MTDFPVSAGSQAPAWESIPYKLLLAILPGSWSFQDCIPKQELGNEQTIALRLLLAPLVNPNQLDFGKNMALHGLFKFGLGG